MEKNVKVTRSVLHFCQKKKLNADVENCESFRGFSYIYIHTHIYIYIDEALTITPKPTLNFTIVGLWSQIFHNVCSDFCMMCSQKLFSNLII